MDNDKYIHAFGFTQKTFNTKAKNNEIVQLLPKAIEFDLMVTQYNAPLTNTVYYLFALGKQFIKPEHIPAFGGGEDEEAVMISGYLPVPISLPEYEMILMSLVLSGMKLISKDELFQFDPKEIVEEGMNIYRQYMPIKYKSLKPLGVTHSPDLNNGIMSNSIKTHILYRTNNTRVNPERPSARNLLSPRSPPIVSAVTEEEVSSYTEDLDKEQSTEPEYTTKTATPMRYTRVLNIPENEDMTSPDIPVESVLIATAPVSELSGSRARSPILSPRSPSTARSPRSPPIDLLTRTSPRTISEPSSPQPTVPTPSTVNSISPVSRSVNLTSSVTPRTSPSMTQGTSPYVTSRTSPPTQRQVSPITSRQSQSISPPQSVVPELSPSTPSGSASTSTARLPTSIREELRSITPSGSTSTLNGNTFTSSRNLSMPNTIRSVSNPGDLSSVTVSNSGTPLISSRMTTQ